MDYTPEQRVMIQIPGGKWVPGTFVGEIHGYGITLLEVRYDGYTFTIAKNPMRVRKMSSALGISLTR